MLTAVGSNGLSNSYTYDADGRRTRRSINNNSEVWLQIFGIGGELVAEYQVISGTPTLKKEYGYRNGQLLVIVEASSSNCQWLVSDALGTPRILADQTGSLTGIKRRDYLPFGEEILAGVGHRGTSNGYSGSPATVPRQQFTGKERDNETGLDYFEARYYGAVYGRFTSPDEFTGGPDELFDFAGIASDNPLFYADLHDPQSLNKYQYCYNNPLNSIDPDGHSVWTKVAKIAVKIYKKGDAVAAVKETFEDVATVFDPSKSVGERVLAGVSLLSEASPVSISDVKDLYKGASSLKNKADDLIGAYGKHGDLLKEVKGHNGNIQSHHIIQNKAVKNLPGYNEKDAPAIILSGPSTNRNTQHGRTRVVQRQRGGGTYAAERRIGYKAIRRADVNKKDAKTLIKKTDEYFQSIGVTPETRTTPIKDRRNP